MRNASCAVPTMLAIVAVALGGAVAADMPPPRDGFSLPIACEFGSDCWVMNYPDMEPDKDAVDPFCGPRSYNGHNGTDFAIGDAAAMREGVDVLASADGIVKAIRDEMEDRVSEEPGRAALRGRDCGNGVVIDHGGGWQTQYCHMRRGSIAVKPGERVTRGQRLGFVGLSGRTAFPHVHLSVRRDGTDIDPYTGRALSAGCDRARAGESLWHDGDALPYQPGALYAAGVATGPVEAATIKDDASSPTDLRTDAPALVLWAAAFGVRAGDRLILELSTPDDTALAKRTVTIERDQAWRMAYTGVKRKSGAWPAGTYRGTIRLLRDGPDAVDQTRTVEVEIR